MVGAASPVAAHTEFDYSTPADGDTVDEPVGEIVVAFTDVVEPVGNGFEVLDPAENVVVPEVLTDDDAVFRLVLDPPLAGGVVGVRYEVMAEDGHVQTGGFSFTVDATAPTTSTVPPTTAAPETTVSPPTSGAGATTTVAPTTAPPTTAPETTTPASPSTTVAPNGGFSAGGWLFGVIGAALILAGLSWLLSRRRSNEPEPG